MRVPAGPLQAASRRHKPAAIEPADASKSGHRSGRDYDGPVRPSAINQRAVWRLNAGLRYGVKASGAVLGLTMPPGLPHRPPLAMRLWLFRRSGREGGTGSATAGRSLGRTMSIESLEHMVRNRVRMFLRHTWLVTILRHPGARRRRLGRLLFHDRMRTICGSPPDRGTCKFVQALADQIAKQHRDLHLQLVRPPAPRTPREAMSKGQADLAILPSNLDDSLNWPVVAILRQNVMALIVPRRLQSRTGRRAKPAERRRQRREAPAKAKTAKQQSNKGRQKRKNRSRQGQRRQDRR